MNFSKVVFKSQDTTEQALSSIRLGLMTLGADQIDSANPRLLAVRGLVELVALTITTPAAVDMLAAEVKARQEALQGPRVRPVAGPCHYPTKGEVRNSGDSGTAGDAVRERLRDQYAEID